MGLIQGSMSICRYRVLGGRGGARIPLSDLNRCLDPYRAPKLTLQDLTQETLPKDESIGWVRPNGLDLPDLKDLPPDAPWDMSHATVDDGLVLRMRIERRAVPAQLLQMIYKDRFFEEQEKTGRTPGPKERRALKEEVKGDLMRRALPTISFIEALWRDQAGDLFLFSTSKKARQLFEVLFTKTFADKMGLSLVHLGPPLLGLSETEWTDADEATRTLERLSSAAPSAFASALEA